MAETVGLYWRYASTAFYVGITIALYISSQLQGQEKVGWQLFNPNVNKG